MSYKLSAFSPSIDCSSIVMSLGSTNRPVRSDHALSVSRQCSGAKTLLLLDGGEVMLCGHCDLQIKILMSRVWMF